MTRPRPLTGWLPVAFKEGRATLLSPRLLIIAALLALAVLAGTYAIAPGAGGGAGAPAQLAYGFTYFPDLDASNPALGLLVATPTGEAMEGQEVHLASVTFRRTGPDEFEILETKRTDATGWARFEGLVERYPDAQLTLVLGESERTYAYAFTASDAVGEPLENRGQMASHLTPLGGQFDRQVYSFVFVDMQGEPLMGADVFILRLSDDLDFDPWSGEEPEGGWEPYHNGTTDGRGFYLRSEPLESGEYAVRVALGDLSDHDFFGFFASPNPLTAGPDGVLAFAGLVFLPLLLPIMALVLAYDAVARERSEGSLDLLLSKPVSRLGVALGKLAGAFGTMALPVVAVLLSAAALVWVLTGESPTPSFLGGLLGTALFLLLAYTLLFLAVSANVRNLGTALLVSILLFLLFAFFWSLISFVIASLLASPGSVAWFQIVVGLGLATPTGVYQQLLTLFLPALLGGFFGPFGGAGQAVPWSWIAVSGAGWVGVPLALFLWAMKFRVTEG